MSRKFMYTHTHITHAQPFFVSYVSYVMCAYTNYLSIHHVIHNSHSTTAHSTAPATKSNVAHLFRLHFVVSIVRVCCKCFCVIFTHSSSYGLGSKKKEEERMCVILYSVHMMFLPPSLKRHHRECEYVY